MGKSGPGILRHRFLANFRIQVEDRLDLEAVLPNSRPAPSTMRNSLALTALISFSASIPLSADVKVSPTPVRTGRPDHRSGNAEAHPEPAPAKGRGREDRPL